jgi:1-acyl-sn-glycerol-3-phosphate acyltransferase
MSASRASDLWHQSLYPLVYAAYTLAWGLRTEGSRHVPRTGPVLILANHESFLDPAAVGLAVRRPIGYLARKTLFRSRLFAALMPRLGAVAVDQEGMAKEGIRASLDILQSGRPLLVFPEGERTSTGEMQPFKPGIHLLLRRAEAPVLPVGIAGAFDAFPRRAKLPKLTPLFWPAEKGRLAVSVGAPVPARRFADLPREQALKELFGLVHAQVGRARRLRGNS